ncbi:MAG: hypothetical protein H6815_04335 [Phycisphaeraceae bacterium]|nr:hypothetical protein [Phycisphaerales bacterium]MCB9859660.1 hypothetical protein [Phycisphaeraceae bacterium]
MQTGVGCGYGRAASVLMILCACGSVASAQAQFVACGPAPAGPSGSTKPIIKVVDNTGAVMGVLGNGPFIWTQQNGFQFLPVLNSGYGIVTGTSSDGTVTYGMNWNIGGSAYPVIWYTRTQPPTGVPGFPSGWTCYGTFGNEAGTFVNGLLRQNSSPNPYNTIFWEATAGTSFVSEYPVGMVQAYVADFNAPGTMGVGNSFGSNGQQAVRWTASGGFEPLGDAPGGTFNSALISLDANGWRAAGTATPESNKPTAAVWDPKDGWTVVGLLNPADSGSDLRIDDSGMVGVGQSGYGSNPLPNAIMWTVRDGLLSFQEVLEQEYGLDLGGWHLTGAQAISASGQYVAGEGRNPQGEIQLWFAYIPDFCYADCDWNGTLNIFDYICFGNHFTQQDMYANCNSDMQINIFDYICFGNAYAAGCP